jgi:Zn-dependent protease with chaperone function
MFTGKGLNSFVIQLEIGLIIVTAVVVRALWVRLPAPEGLKLAREEQPRLFEMIDEIRRVVRGPKVRAVFLTEEINASVVSVPRLGLFGWPRHYLLIGLPLMYMLSPAEFRATIAHEMGHLAGAHGSFSRWIYRVNSTWFELMCNLTGRKEWASILFNRFFRWYVPYFGTYSATLLRNHEFQADLCAAEAASAQAIAAALIRLEVYRPVVYQFWDDVWQRTASQSSPPPAFAELAEWLRARVPEDDARRSLEAALSRETSSHPPLSKRLEALGKEAQLPESITESTAEYYLQNDLQRLIDRLNQDYQERVREEWETSYQEFCAARNELSELNRKAAEGNLTVEEAYQRACLTAEAGNYESVLELFREILDRHPDHALTNFRLGQLLLSQKQDGGIRFLERAMDLDEDYVYAALTPGCSPDAS